MAKFTDELGREWNVRITGVEMLAISEEHKLDIGRAFENNCQMLADLAVDLPKFVGVLFTTLQKQCFEQDVSPESFAEGLYGDAIQGAWDAWQDAVVNFFPDPRRRETIRKILAMHKKLADEIIRREEEMVTNLEGPLSSALSTSSLDLSESIQDLINSGSSA